MSSNHILASDRPASRFSRRDVMLRSASVGVAVQALSVSTAPGARAAASLPDELDAILAGGISAGLPGVAIRVEHTGEVVYASAAGVSDLERDTPLTVNDRFRIYSITKTFTATIVLQMVDEGLLALDSTVAQLLDDPVALEIPNIDRISLRHLLTHTSGIYDYLDGIDSPFYGDAFVGPRADRSRLWIPQELLAYADRDRHAPYFEPGHGVHYSNTNYILLGLIVEAATGNAFGDELRTRIVEPLALTGTTLETGAIMPADMVHAYQWIGGVQADVSATNVSWVWSAGGIVSTTADLARFADAALAGDIITDDSRQAMLTPVPQSAVGFGVGMGVFLVQTPYGEIVSTTGGATGGSATIAYLPDAAITVVVLSNLFPDGGATNAVRDMAIDVVLAEQEPLA